MTDLPEAARAWVESAVAPRHRVVAVRWFARSSTDKHVVDLEDAAGSITKLMLRRFFDVDRLRTDAWYAPSHELEVLRAVEGSDVPAPRVVAADLAPASCDVPALLTTFLPGEPRWRPSDLGTAVRRFAEELVRIHNVSAESPPLRPYEAYYTDEPGRVRPPSWTTRPGLWERVLAAIRRDAPRDEVRFIHRDYHQGNVLWQGHRISGVIDWTTGCIGPRGIDLGRMRLNLAREMDPKAADAFLDAWRVAAGGDAGWHPYWDLVEAADSVPDLGPPANADEASLLRGFEIYVEHVLAELG